MGYANFEEEKWKKMLKQTQKVNTDHTDFTDS